MLDSKRTRANKLSHTNEEEVDELEEDKDAEEDEDADPVTYEGAGKLEDEGAQTVREVVRGQTGSAHLRKTVAKSQNWSLSSPSFAVSAVFRAPHVNLLWCPQPPLTTWNVRAEGNVD